MAGFCLAVTSFRILKVGILFPSSTRLKTSREQKEQSPSQSYRVDAVSVPQRQEGARVTGGFFERPPESSTYYRHPR